MDKAIDAYEFALAIEPERESALCKRSIAYLATDDPILYQKGKTYLEAYCRQHPEKAELKHILNSLDKLYEQTDLSVPLPFDDEELTDNWMKDINLPEEDEAIDIDWNMLRNPTTDFEDYIEVIDMLFESRKYDKALEALDVLIPLHPEEPTLYLDYGIILMQKDMEDEAESYFDKTLLKVSNSDDKDFFLGEIGFQYFCKEHYSDALDYYFRIRDIQELHEHLPYMAACFLELDYENLYKEYVLRLEPETDEEQYKEIHRAFYGHLPLNLRPEEMKSFLLKLFNRYNS